MGCLFFQDFLNDDGDSFVSKRVLGHYKREVNSVYRDVVSQFRGGGRPNVVRCCGLERKNDGHMMRLFDARMNSYFGRETVLKSKVNKKKKKKIVYVYKNVNDVD